jgi:hypothetical protein
LIGEDFHDARSNEILVKTVFMPLTELKSFKYADVNLFGDVREMKFKDEKVVGYILLAVGVVMIFSSVFLMFNVFTGASAPPRLFDFPDISLPIPQPGGAPQTVRMISGQDMSTIVAMVFWYLLMFFIMLAGGKIASLGVNLIREIRVEVKQ